MDRISVTMKVARVVPACLLTLAFASTPAAADPQSKDQQNCINTMNKSGAKVAATQGKENAGCVKSKASGKLFITVDACMTADSKGKVGKAKSKTTDGQTKKCAIAPDFGFTSATAVNAAAGTRQIELTEQIFGDPVDPNIIDAAADKTGAKCQQSVQKTYEKLSSTRLKNFVSCKKGGLKAETIVDATGIEACIDDDTKGKVAKARTKVKTTIDKKCPSVDLAVAFPGCGVGTSQALADCAAAQVDCRACLMVNGMDAVNAPCDELDNGVVDGSCPQCGNSIVEVGEECDDGGESAACDTDCTFAKCNDGIVNTAAGEECEDGNAIETDPCTGSCRTATCGDGLVCSDPACTSGPGGGPEECDLGADNGGTLCSLTCELPPQDANCPDRADLTLFAGTGKTCANNADCPVGTCTSGRCRTATDLDTGWTGIAHDADINDDYRTRGKLVCPGPDPGCGDCIVTGLDPEPGNCRCASVQGKPNNNRIICDEPFQPDQDDCGGDVCDCYIGAPLPLSAGNTPACVVNRFAFDVTGTTNIDSGAGELAVKLRSRVFLGETLVQPCPYCSGKCTAPATGRCTAGNVGASCSTNSECDVLPGSGVCSPSKAGQACRTNSQCDILPGDGVCTADTPKDDVQDGICVSGRNAGQACDVDEVNTTFPAPGGGGSSFDCFPDTGKNISGDGLIINLDTTTGAQSLSANLTCGFPPGGPFFDCHCGVCSLDTLRPCASDADCLGFGVCQPKGSGDPLPNQCDGFACSAIGGGEGECTTGPTDKSCDVIVRSNGAGFISCQNNADCSQMNIGVAAGNCTLTKRRKCFLDPITATGAAAPGQPKGVSIFCIPPTSNAAINTVAGIPGPGRVVNQTTSQPICSDDSLYTPGGSCP